MYKRFNKNTVRSNINFIKEAGYILLLVMFFIGMLFGSISLKNVSETSIETNKELIQKSILLDTVNQKNNYLNSAFSGGIKTIIIFWIIGLSVFGTPILVIYIGYKGYSLGHTISAIIKILGSAAGNKYIFQNLFLKETILVFIMAFMANYSMRIFKDFFENKENISADAIKYTIISVFLLLVFCLFFTVLRAIVWKNKILHKKYLQNNELLYKIMLV